MQPVAVAVVPDLGQKPDPTELRRSNWNSATVIECCQSFLVNSFMNVQTYVMFNE